MLLSDRDLEAAIRSGRLGLEPWEPALLQPSSVDVRLDRYFRVFNNFQYTHIDPQQQQDDLTTPIEPEGDNPFVLHPGEFVLGSTLEVVSLGDDLAGRLEGKALAVDTPIPTPDGWRPMGSLSVGDEVFDEAGSPTAVVAVSEVMCGRPCRRVVFSDRSVITADAGHLWLTQTKAERVQGRDHYGVRTTDEIGDSLHAGAERNHHVALAGPAQYRTAALPIDPWLLGYWLGDGTSTKAEITVGEQDEVFVRGQLEALGLACWPANQPRAFRVGCLAHGQGSRRRDPKGRYGRDGSLSSALRELGVLGNKHVPDEYLIADVEQRTALLQGLMDSDGYADVYGRCEFVNVRECLSDAVVELAASLGLRPVKRKKRVTLNGIDVGPAYQVKFTPRIPVFRLPRKLARLKTDGHAHAFRSIVAVETTESVPVRCIQVAASSGMFLAGRTYIPTHNSSLGRLGLLTHSTAGFIDPGFSGHITLELSNVANLPITLWPGMKIGQLCVFRLSSPTEFPYGSAKYGSRYQGQRGPTPSRSYLNFRRWPTT